MPAKQDNLRRSQLRSIALSAMASFFGFFFKGLFAALKPVDGILPPNIFSLPRVVILGTENAGKSSLLENILKTEIFPRHTKLATKCPTRFELTGLPPGSPAITEITWDGKTSVISTDEDILLEVQRIMDSIGDDVNKQELLIKRSAPGLPSITFIDLPGIRTTTKNDMKKKTEDLTNKYLDGDNMFVLVVPAINHIYADPAYGLVTSKNKAASTILVLSKIDDAAKNDVVWHNTVVPRLLGEDEELTAHSFKCVIGTKCRQQNRQNCDEIRIEDADESELAWASHKIMDTDVSAAKRVALHGHLTVSSLLARMNEFFHAYATGPWKASSLEKLGPAKIAAERALKDLGTPPEALTPDILLLELESRLKAHWLNPMPQLPSFGGVTQTRNSRESTDAAAGIITAVETWLDAELNAAKPATLLGRAELLKAFDDVFGDDKLELRTKRFGAARWLLVHATLDKFVACAAAHCPEIKRRALDQLEAALCAGGPAPVAAAVANVLTAVIHRCVGPALSVLSVLRADASWKEEHGAALLKEDAPVAADRIAMMKKVQDIQDCIEIVGDIDKLPARGVTPSGGGAASGAPPAAASAPSSGGGSSSGRVHA